MYRNGHHEGKILGKYFYQKDACSLAQNLLGQVLCRRMGKKMLKGRIVETEAYCGISDKGCHAYGNRRTSRTNILYGPGGYAYVYIIYGLHFCMNVTAGKAGDPQCVFLRALEPMDGVEIMQANRKTEQIKHLTNGPGKLCQALAIDKSLYGADLTTGEALWIERGEKPAHISAGPRVNIDYAGEDALLPYRYYITDNPYVSPK